MEEKAEVKFLLRLNEPMPDFEAVTTHDKIRLSDFRGRWVILFSHPADFTPVCTTEFVAFAKIHDDIAKRNAQLISLSIEASTHTSMRRLVSLQKETSMTVRR